MNAHTDDHQPSEQQDRTDSQERDSQAADSPVFQESDALHILHDISLRLGSTLDLSQVLEKIVESAVRLIAATDAHIYLYDAATGVATFGAAYWHDGSRKPITREQSTRGLVATVARQGQPLVINDALSHPLYADSDVTQWDVHAFAGFPLKWNERVVGVFTVAFLQAHTFGEQETHLLELLADQAAVAIENARLVDELRASEDKYHHLVDNFLEGVFLTQDGVIKYANPAFFRTTGYTAEELIDRLAALDLVVPEARARLAEQGQHMMDGEPLPIPLEFRALRKDGRKIDLEVTASIIQYRGRRAIQGTVRDITARKEAEAELRRLKEFNERIVQGMEEGVLIEDERGFVVFANPKLEEVLYYEHGQMVGLHWSALVTPLEVDAVEAHVQKRPAGIKSQYETTIVRRDGSTVPVIVSATPLFEQGRFVGVLSAFTDITARKRAEATLHTLNSAALAVQQAQDPADVFPAVTRELERLGFRTVIALLDELGERLVVKHISNMPHILAEAEAILGIQVQDLAVTLADVPSISTVMYERRALLIEDMADLVRQILPGDPKRAQVEALAGTPDFRRGILAPLAVKNRAMGLLAVISPTLAENDIPAVTAFAHQTAIAMENARLYETLRERAERLEEAYDELKRMDRLKDEFVQNVTHELRTPLTFVRGYVDLLQEGMLGPLTEEQREALTVVANRTEGVIRLVNDIMSFKRAEMAELELTTVSLAALARMSARGAEVTAEQNGLKVMVDIPGDLPLVRVDQQRIYQVFDNLLGNAIKFSSPESVITVVLRREDPFVRAEVRDQGIGIPDDQLERIWERFYQVDGTTTRKFGGAGLGLAIVKRIIWAHGGTVGVDSTVGKGSTFYFTVPCADMPSAPRV